MHTRDADVVLRHYKAAWTIGAQVDVVAVEADLPRYDVVLAPCLHMIRDDIAERLEAVVARGGAVVSGALSGRADLDGNAYPDSLPGPLRSLMGIRVEETDSVEPGQGQPIELAGATCRADLVMEILTCEDAEPLASYTEEFYAGTPAATRRLDDSGGEAIYIATVLDDEGYAAVIGQLLRDRGLAGPYADVNEVEFCIRAGDHGRCSSS